MTFDVQILTFAEQSYVYSMESGIIFRSNPLMNYVLHNNHLGLKKMAKELKGKYTIQDIMQTVDQIQSMEQKQMISPKVLQYLTNDHSNLVDLQQVYLEEMSNVVEESFQKLLDRYHLQFDDIQKLPLHKHPFPEKAKNLAEEDSLAILEWFVEKWTAPCKLSILEEESAKLIEAVQNVEKNLLQTIIVLQEQVRIGKTPKILSLLQSIYRKEKKIFSCNAGLDNLVIGKDGRYYQCLTALQMNHGKELEYLGALRSVYDRSACQECFARYLCGGPCSLKKDSYSPDICQLIRQVARVLLGLSLVILEENSRFGEQLIASGQKQDGVIA